MLVNTSPDLGHKLHWLPVKQWIDFRILTYVYKCLHNCAPLYLSELLQPAISQRQLRSNSNFNLVQIRTFSKVGDRASEH